KTIRGIDGDTIDPAASRDVNLTVVMGNDAGILEGVLKDSKGATVPLGVVVLMPDEPNAFLRIATAITNSSGAFKLNAAPGSYHGYGWTELIGAPYLDADYLKKISEKGIAVRIDPNGRSRMDLTPLQGQ